MVVNKIKKTIRNDKYNNTNLKQFKIQHSIMIQE